LSRPSGRSGSYTGLIGFNSRRLKGLKGDELPRNRPSCLCEILFFFLGVISDGLANGLGLDIGLGQLGLAHIPATCSHELGNILNHRHKTTKQTDSFNDPLSRSTWMSQKHKIRIQLTAPLSLSLLLSLTVTVTVTHSHCYCQSLSLILLLTVTVTVTHSHCYCQSLSLILSLTVTVAVNHYHCYCHSQSLLLSITVTVTVTHCHRYCYSNSLSIIYLHLPRFVQSVSFKCRLFKSLLTTSFYVFLGGAYLNVSLPQHPR